MNRMVCQYPSKTSPAIFQKLFDHMEFVCPLSILFILHKAAIFIFVSPFFAHRNLVQMISFTKKGHLIYLCNIYHSSTLTRFRYRRKHNTYFFLGSIHFVVIFAAVVLIVAIFRCPFFLFKLPACRLLIVC